MIKGKKPKPEAKEVSKAVLVDRIDDDLDYLQSLLQVMARGGESGVEAVFLAVLAGDAGTRISNLKTFLEENNLEDRLK